MLFRTDTARSSSRRTSAEKLSFTTVLSNHKKKLIPISTLASLPCIMNAPRLSNAGEECESAYLQANVSGKSF